jgi:peptide/nickel transport system permease protein
MRFIRSFFRHWQNALGLFIVVFFAAIAIAAPRLAPPETEIISTAKLNLKGFDKLAPVAPSPRIPSGYSTGWFNQFVMRLTDAMLAFPVVVGVVLFKTILEILVSNAFKGDPVAIFMYRNGVANTDGLFSPLAGFLMKLDPLMVALIFLSWMPYARITNTIIIGLRQLDYVEASRALGAGHLRVIFRHLVPNAITPSMVLAARDIGFVVMLQASLTFIHLAGGSEWGGLLAQAERWIIGPGGNLLVRWWVFFPATLALVLFGIGWNLVGDGLNDMLNPQTY